MQAGFWQMWSTAISSGKTSGVSAPSRLILSLCQRLAIRSAGSGDAGLCGSPPGVPASAAINGDIYQAVTELAHISAKTCGSRHQTTSQRTCAIGSSDCLHMHMHTHVCTYSCTHTAFFHEFLLLLWLSTNCSFEVPVFG